MLLARILILALFLATLSLAAAQEHAYDSDSFDWKSLTNLVVELSDEDGKPVAGASVAAYAMRMKEGDGHGYWDNEKLGPPKYVQSDAQGRATIKYPAKVEYLNGSRTTSLVTFQVQHFDFVQKVVHFVLGPEKAKVVLKRGCEIRLSAVDHLKKPINKFAVLVAGPFDPSVWTDDPNGGRRTGAASDGNWQTLIVKPQPDGRTLFSSVLPLRVRPEQAVRIRNIRLKPGTQLTGTLSHNVPRPIKNGIVITTTAAKPAGYSWAKEDPSVTWTEWTTIDANGDFELKSIPRSGKVQVIAICDNWISTTIPKEEFIVKGQLFDIDDDQVQVVVEMERTATVQLSTPDGDPLDGGKVGSWPYQEYDKGGSTLLGERHNSLTIVESQLVPANERQAMNFRQKFSLPFSN